MVNRRNAITSCDVAFPSRCNSATQPLEAEIDNATDDLLSLSSRVLARNQRNPVRNYDAIDQLHSHVSCATDNMKIVPVELYGFTLKELEVHAEEDWPLMQHNIPALNAFAELLYEQQLIKAGHIPARFTATTFCISCNRQVKVPPALVNDGRVLGCVHCAVRSNPITGGN